MSCPRVVNTIGVVFESEVFQDAVALIKDTAAMVAACRVSAKGHTGGADKGRVRARARDCSIGHHLGDARFASAWAEGRRLTLELAVNLTLERVS